MYSCNSPPPGSGSVSTSSPQWGHKYSLAMYNLWDRIRASAISEFSTIYSTNMRTFPVGLSIAIGKSPSGDNKGSEDCARD